MALRKRSLLRRRFAGAVLAVLSACFAITVVHAQEWPARPIAMITPLAVGTASDVALRIVGEKLAESLGQPLVIQNLTGASGAIGAEKVAVSAPDGYTLCGCNNAILTVLPNVRKVTYDPMKSYRPVGTVASLPTALVVRADLPVKTIPELIAYIKAHPDAVRYATGGQGSAQHIAMAMFEAATGVKSMHVPYKGAGPAAVAAASGEVDMMFNAIGTVMPMIKSGKLRAIAVAGADRTPVMPDVPTVAEQGVPGFDYASWIGIVAPAGTPDDVVNKVSSQLTKVLQAPDTLKKLNDNGIDAMVMTPAQMTRYMATEYARMTKLVNESGIKE